MPQLNKWMETRPRPQWCPKKNQIGYLRRLSEIRLYPQNTKWRLIFPTKSSVSESVQASGYTERSEESQYQKAAFDIWERIVNASCCWEIVDRAYMVCIITTNGIMRKTDLPWFGPLYRFVRFHGCWCLDGRVIPKRIAARIGWGVGCCSFGVGCTSRTVNVQACKESCDDEQNPIEKDLVSLMVWRINRF